MDDEAKPQIKQTIDIENMTGDERAILLDQQYQLLIQSNNNIRIIKEIIAKKQKGKTNDAGNQSM